MNRIHGLGGFELGRLEGPALCQLGKLGAEELHPSQRDACITPLRNSTSRNPAKLGNRYGAAHVVNDSACVMCIHAFILAD